jgi:hypothetical protein
MRSHLRLTLAVAMLFPLSVFAQSLKDTPLLSPIGMSAMIGGGVIQFVDAGANEMAPLGGSWTARFVFGTRTNLAGELAYLGSAQPIDALGVDDKAYLLSNGLEAAFRLNALTGAWQPYATVGVAWRRFDIQNTERNTSSLASTDNVTELPIGAGLAYRNSGFVADVRVELRPNLNTALIADTNLTSWQAGARLGFEF